MPLTSALTSERIPHEQRGNLRCCAAGFSRNHTVCDHLEEDRPRLRWRVSLPIAVAAQSFEVPGRTVVQKFFEAVSGTHHGTGRHRLRLARPEEEDRSVDVALAMAHHARHQSRRLQPCQPLFGNAGVQTTVGLVDGNRGIHVLGTRGAAGTAAGKRFTSVPALVRRRSDTHFASVPILSKTAWDINAFVPENTFVFCWLEACRRQNIARWLPRIPCLPTFPRITSGWDVVLI